MHPLTALAQNRRVPTVHAIDLENEVIASGQKKVSGASVTGDPTAPISRSLRQSTRRTSRAGTAGS